MSAWDIWPAVESTTLSPAELAARLDEDLAAHAAGSCPHYRAKHASPPPDIHYPAGDRGRDGAAGHHPDQAEPGRARLAALAGIAAPRRSGSCAATSSRALTWPPAAGTSAPAGGASSSAPRRSSASSTAISPSPGASSQRRSQRSGPTAANTQRRGAARASGARSCDRPFASGTHHRSARSPVTTPHPTWVTSWPWVNSQSSELQVCRSSQANLRTKLGHQADRSASATNHREVGSLHGRAGQGLK